MDDEPLIRKGIRAKLDCHALGIDILEEAFDGIDALKKIKHISPDIVITDIKMPGMDGIHLIKEALLCKQRCRFVVISGYSEFEYAKQAMKLGVQEYILKPVDPLELKRAIITIILSIEEQMKERSNKVFCENCEQNNSNRRETVLSIPEVSKSRNMNKTGDGKEYLADKSNTKGTGFYPNEINEKLITYLRLNNFDQIKKELDILFDYLDKKRLSDEYTYAIVISLKSICLSYITEMGKDIEDVLGKKFSPLSVVNRKITLEMANKLIFELFKKTVIYFSKNKKSKTKKVAEIVKEYIDRNYKDNKLNIERISKSLFLNPDYLRKVFKKELNITLTEYITGVRMRKAKELLESGNIRISDLCCEVGFNDASYFSKCFKKYYGLSPRDYENTKN